MLQPENVSDPYALSSSFLFLIFTAVRIPKTATPAPDRADNPIHRPGLLSSPVFGVVITSSGIFSLVIVAFII